MPILAELLNRPAWHADGACHEHPEVSWFPERGSNGLAAKAVCARCLVREGCLAFAVEHGEVGVWGATTDVERRAMRRDSAA